MGYETIVDKKLHLVFKEVMEKQNALLLHGLGTN